MLIAGFGILTYGYFAVYSSVNSDYPLWRTVTNWLWLIVRKRVTIPWHGRSVFRLFNSSLVQYGWFTAVWLAPCYIGYKYEAWFCTDVEQSAPLKALSSRLVDNVISVVTLLTEGLFISFLFLGVVAFYTLLERKGIAAVQRREGPNVTGPFGLLQPVMDGLKLILKDVSASDEADAEAYDFAPLLTFGVSFTGWALLPVGLSTGGMILSDYTILLFLCVTTLGIFGIVGAGWATKSKYAILGSLRAISQFIAYEVYFSLILLPFFLLVGTDFMSVWERQAHTSLIFPFFPLFIIFFITMLVETNRAPFDMPEAEAELVAGFNVEYSASAFALFFLAEYNSMITASTLMALLFFGGDSSLLPNLFGQTTTHWGGFFILKIVLLCFSFVFVRANFPRVRFDQLLLMGWKVCLPVSLGFLWLVFSLKMSM